MDAIERAMKLAKARRLAIQKNMEANRVRGKEAENASNKPVKDSRGPKNFEDVCSKQDLDIHALKEQNANLQFELRKCNYELRKAMEREGAATEAERTESMRNRTISNNMHKSLENLERRVADREAALFEDCNRVQNLVAALERHCQRGLHAVSSTTGTGLVLKIKQGLQAMRNAVHYSGNSSVAVAAAAAAHEADKAETLDNTLLEMCQHLEDENRRLNVTVQECMAEAEAAKKEAAAAPLIRHYRMAIVRSRAETERVKDKLAEEREVSQGLRIELERCMQDLCVLAGDLVNGQGASKELPNVDRDIEDLKRKLRETAIAQTSDVVSSVLRT